MKTTKASANALTDVLWDTLNVVKNGGLSPDQGQAVASQAKQILQTVKLRLQIAAQCQRPVSADVIAFSES